MAEGFHDFAAAEVLTAANTDDYLMRQTVMRFADVSARNSALSGVLVEGLLAYTKDANRFWIYTGSAWQLAGGSLPRCRVYSTVANALASGGAGTRLVWDSESYDTDTLHSTSLNIGRITIPSEMGGLWHFECSNSWEAVGGGGSGVRQTWFYVNGTGAYHGLNIVPGTSASIITQGISSNIPVTAGDYVEAFAVHTQGSDTDAQVNTGANVDYLACHFVGPTF